MLIHKNHTRTVYKIHDRWQMNHTETLSSRSDQKPPNMFRWLTALEPRSAPHAPLPTRARPKLVHKRKFKELSLARRLLPFLVPWLVFFLQSYVVCVPRQFGAVIHAAFDVIEKRCGNSKGKYPIARNKLLNNNQQ